MTSDALKGLSVVMLSTFSTEELAAIGSSAIRGLSTGFIASLSTSRVAALGTAGIAGLTSDQVSAFGTDQIEALYRPDRRPEFGRVGQIDGGGYRNILNRGTRSPQFDGNQGIDRLRRELPVFSGHRRSYNKPGGISELWSGRGNGIRAGRRIIAASDQCPQRRARSGAWRRRSHGVFQEQIISLSSSAVSGLSTGTLATLKASQASAFTPCQVGGMTTAQVSALNSAKTTNGSVQDIASFISTAALTSAASPPHRMLLHHRWLPARGRHRQTLLRPSWPNLNV